MTRADRYKRKTTDQVREKKQYKTTLHFSVPRYMARRIKDASSVTGVAQVDGGEHRGVRIPCFSSQFRIVFTF